MEDNTKYKPEEYVRKDELIEVIQLPETPHKINIDNREAVLLRTSDGVLCAYITPVADIFNSTTVDCVSCEKSISNSHREMFFLAGWSIAVWVIGVLFGLFVLQ